MATSITNGSSNDLGLYAAPATTDIARSVCFYGPTGSGKTREILALALYIWEKYKLKTRYITCDGGGMEALDPFIQGGLIEVINLTAHKDFIPLLRAVSKGYKLLPEGKGVSKEVELEGIGMVAFESLSQCCEEIMSYYKAKGTKFAQDLVAKSVLVVEDESITQAIGQQTVASVSQAHYGGLKDEIFTLVREIQSLSNYGVKLTAFTSHESSGTEQLAGAKLTTLGIGALGQAMGPTLPRKFGDLIHLTTKTISGKLQYRAYFTPHIEQAVDKEWPARLRATPAFTQGVMKDPRFKEGYFVLDDNKEADPDFRKGVTELFRFRDEFSSKTVDRVKAMLNSKSASDVQEKPNK